MDSNMPEHPVPAEVCGVPVWASDPVTVTRDLARAAVAGERGHVCVAAADMVTRAVTDPKLMSVMRSAKLVTSDGAPVVWMLRRKGFPWAQRVYGPDLMRRLCGECEAQGIPVFFFGGTEQEIAMLVAVARRRWPRLTIAGAIAPPMLPADPPVEPEVVNAIRESGARIVFVGLGCPKQEYWMKNYGPHLDTITVGVGYAFAQIAGLKSRAPDWMAKVGLEWLYRLGQEPKRLWKRYLIGNSLFIWYCAKDLAGRSPVG